jgi:fibronectin-binding autotransporter adhesin
VFNTSGSLTSTINVTGGSIGTLTVNVGSGNTASLGADIAITSALNLQSGMLDLNRYNITISGTIAGSGSISSTSISNITINTNGGTGGILNFASGSSSNNITIMVGSGNQVQVGGSLDVTGTLALNSGILNFSGTSLTIDGAVNGSGMLSGSSSSNLTINTSGGISGSLNFASGGQTVNNLTVNVGSGNSVTLATGLTIGGDLSLTGGSNLTINDDTITLNGSLSGTGSLQVNTGTTLIINSTGGLSTPLSINGTLGTLVVNVGSSSSVTLGSSVVVSNVISLQSGALVLNSNNLTITGNIAGGGSGTIAASASSGLVINTSLTTTGGLTFAAGADTIGSLSVNTGGSLSIGSNVVVADSVGLNGGTINMGSDTLTIAAGGWITGGDSSAYIIVTGSGALGLQVTTGNSGWVNFPVGTTANFAPILVELNTGSSSAGTVYVTANGGVLAQGTGGANLSLTQPVVNITWMVEPSLTTNINLNLMAMWSTALQVNGFNPDSAYLSHFINGSWNTSAVSSASIAANGMYQLQLSDVTSFSPFAVFGSGASSATGIVEVTGNDNEFDIYPNPVSDNLIVKNISGANLVYAEIIDISGQVIARYQLTNLTSNLSLSKLSAGNYFIRLFNDNLNEVKKIIKM